MAYTLAPPARARTSKPPRTLSRNVTSCRLRCERWLVSATEPNPLAAAGEPQLTPSGIRTDKAEADAPTAMVAISESPKKVEAFRAWVGATYPSGIPAGTGVKTLKRHFENITKISIHERTIRRSLGGK